MTTWRPMTPADLGEVHAIADRVHRDHPEDLAVLAERQNLFPRGCRVLEGDRVLLGYAISHPWEFGRPPALNTRLQALPAAPTTYYLHDVALLPDGRGRGRAAGAVEWLVGLAEELRFDTLSLVAVDGTRAFWEKFGFAPTAVPGLSSKLSSYGGDAVFMVREIGKPTRERATRPAD